MTILLVPVYKFVDFHIGAGGPSQSETDAKSRSKIVTDTKSRSDVERWVDSDMSVDDDGLQLERDNLNFFLCLRHVHQDT